MPLLTESDPSFSVQLLDSSSYSDSPDSIAGFGVSPAVYRDMTLLLYRNRSSVDILQEHISRALTPLAYSADSNVASQYAAEKQAKSGFAQAKGVALSQVAGEVRARVPQAEGDFVARFGGQGLKKALNPPANNGGSKINDAIANIDISALTRTIQQQSRNVFTVSQTLSVNKMIADWLTVIQDVIEAANDAEAALAKVVGDINAQRQAIWSSVGGILGAVLTYSVPPPAGAILGAVVVSVFSEDSWSKAFALGAKWGVQANQPVSNSSSTLGPYEIQTIYGQEKISDAKDWFATIGGLHSCLGKSSQETLAKFNEKTLRHVTDLPKPAKAQAKSAIQVIRKECSDRLRRIFEAVNEVVSEFAGTYSGPATLAMASWDIQQNSILSYFKSRPNDSELQRAEFLNRQIVNGANYYLNTAANEILVTLAASCKPKFNRFNFDKEAVQKQFEIYFWAKYLSLAAAKTAPAAVQMAKATVAAEGTGATPRLSLEKTPRASDEDYFAYHYGTLKTLVWRGAVESKLNELGITAKYSGKSGLLHLSSRTDEYKQAITRWRPPARTGPWQPVPYQQGGNNAQGRLIAWATEYVERPPQELYQKILG